MKTMHIFVAFGRQIQQNLYDFHYFPSEKIVLIPFYCNYCIKLIVKIGHNYECKTKNKGDNFC